MEQAITIRAFRAIDEPDTCQQFYQGHIDVLRSYGVEPVSSSQNDWFYDKGVYGLIAEREGKVLGGVKIHKAHNGSELPLKKSIGYLEPKIDEVIEEQKTFGTGESCGLWNSREIAGRGVSYLLMRAMISISNKISVLRLLSLSSDHTVGMCRELGYHVLTDLGDKGDFTYPTPAYIARVVLLNSKTLLTASPYNRTAILSLRENPEQTRIESGPKEFLKVDYRLNI